MVAALLVGVRNGVCLAISYPAHKQFIADSSLVSTMVVVNL